VRIPTLGSRGQGWVALQFVLMAVIVVAGFLGPAWPEGVDVALDVVGTALALAGGALGIWAGSTLGSALTPYPEPTGRGQLVAAGPYRIVRHPIYAAGIAFFVGYGLFSRPLALVLTLVLAVLWALKSSVEEQYLGAHYEGYAAYADEVRWRLVPGVY
jgi:protein-S-isoprenylcysteine O-methyltransferase Ste14